MRPGTLAPVKGTATAAVIGGPGSVNPWGRVHGRDFGTQEAVGGEVGPAAVLHTPAAGPGGNVA
jgi:hypothetical protein